MRLFSPWALWFLSFIPLVILMYILKQKFEEQVVSSTYLWRQVLKDMEVNTPWQKLKKNLLLFMQLLSILLLVLALSDPYLYMGSKAYSRMLIIMDISGSMSTAYQGDNSRLDAAKSMAESLVRNSGANTEITIISSGKTPKLLLNKSLSKAEALNTLKNVRSDNSQGNMAEAESLAEAVARSEGAQAKGYKAYFYTDADVDTEGLNAEVIGLGGAVENVSLDYIAHKHETDGLEVLLRITNRSEVKLTREVSLYNGDKLSDIASVELGAKETKTVYFKGVTGDSGYIWAELSEKDALPSDNIIYEVVRSNGPQRVLLVSKQNIFIEKVLKSIEGIELYKTNPGESVEGQYELYIYDGCYPDKLPSAGNIMLINPPSGNSLIETGAELEGGRATAHMHQLTRYADKQSFAVSKMKKLQAPYWADVLFSVGGNPVILSGENKERKIAAFAFDLHDSDFVLMPEFPIFTYNLMGYMLNIDMGTQKTYMCGEQVNLSLLPDAKSAQVNLPDGRSQKVEIKYPVRPFEDTTAGGIYRLMQKRESGETVSLFAVNFPVESESKATSFKGHQVNGAAATTAVHGGVSIQALMIFIVLLMAAAEWGVYIRGY